VSSHPLDRNPGAIQRGRTLGRIAYRRQDRHHSCPAIVLAERGLRVAWRSF